MDYIILDIEFNGRKFASELPMEVIEIGAVRLDSELKRKDDFSSLVKPVYFSKLNSFIKKKTGIAQEEIDRAGGFRNVIADFKTWLQQSESFLLVTWGGEDMKRIIQDTRMHKLDDAFWMSIRYYDLLKGYLRCTNRTNDVSVENALLELGIAMEGAAHRALEDAKMTAEVFRSVFGQLDLERTQQYVDTYSNAKERRLVKHGLRAMTAQRMAPEWELLAEHFLKGKMPLDDPRKVAELKQYFATEAKKLGQRQPSPNAAGTVEVVSVGADASYAAGTNESPAAFQGGNRVFQR